MELRFWRAASRRMVRTCEYSDAFAFNVVEIMCTQLFCLQEEEEEGLLAAEWNIHQVLEKFVQRKDCLMSLLLSWTDDMR